MKAKHLAIRIQQCLALGKASTCACEDGRTGALLLDPERNVVLMDGYSGGPRGGDALCGGFFCIRKGIPLSDIVIRQDSTHFWVAEYNDYKIPGPNGVHFKHREACEAHAARIATTNPPRVAAKRSDVGCYHAETNVICGCAARGVSSAGAWLISSVGPCMMCAKLIYHSGIVRVITTDTNYTPTHPGARFLRNHNVSVDILTGPDDLRLLEIAACAGL